MSFTSGRPLWREVYLVAGARAISYCGDFLAATTLALTLQTRGEGGYAVAALLIASTLPIAVLAPLAGRLVDRVDSRTLLVATGLAQAVVCAALAYTSGTVAMVALVAVISAGLAVSQPTLSALVPEMVGREDLPRAMSISQTANAVGMLLGPMLGGLLIGAYGARLPLLLDAVTYLALAGVGLVLTTRRRGGSARAPQTVAVAAFRVRNDRLLVTLMASFGAVIAAITAVNVAGIFFIRETLGSSSAMYGLTEAAWMAGVLVGAWPFGRIRGDDRRLVRIALYLLGGVALVVLASGGVRAAAWLIPLYVCGGLFNAGLNVISGVVMSRRVPAQARGQAFATFGAVSNTANMAGYVLGGVLMYLTTPRAILLGVGAAGLVVAAVFLFTSRRDQEMREDEIHGLASVA